MRLNAIPIVVAQPASASKHQQKPVLPLRRSLLPTPLISSTWVDDRYLWLVEGQNDNRKIKIFRGRPRKVNSKNRDSRTQPSTGVAAHE